jgi:cytochrome P450
VFTDGREHTTHRALLTPEFRGRALAVMGVGFVAGVSKAPQKHSGAMQAGPMRTPVMVMSCRPSLPEFLGV